ncbi:putative TMS membrane protein/tumor differentially expressed protein [Monocercomonoides exilis]|uniref:putative TMS membrane protein/tumor differentially expressed protein n=1 Tax=Monocercomonoides exilis TaxID=2049356 RepID=UPI003559BF7A|nr:putative TMS membrane protein/tumor differentially expressed protein [Monocercomonoides exilis]|eukprot:MONOS_3481.1-p1 / transcript=MONOS_3481.1 / gene=MONOS_3481 / organism=Monocercomonoides_exilis_PA203 / gene_product=Membrane protein TMS1 / transcript_product=Membrane protein TMS1 / location=Mono_scaffold00082:92478-94534(-) / protein_length=480 / sequence_SO=supercontig / SO=protein_coding / is_pseudo=false
MGSCIGSCIGSAVGAACIGCCCTCRKKSKSTDLSARIGTLVLLSIGCVLILIGSIWGFRIFNNKPFGYDVGGCIGTIDLCSEKLLVLRIGIALVLTFLFFFLISLIMCFTANSACLSLNNGWWVFKVILFLGVVVGCYFIPPKVVSGLFYVMVIGSAIFLIIQIVLLITFFDAWNESWRDKNCLAGLTIFTIIVSIGWIILTALTYVFYNKCTLDLVLTSVGVAFAIIMILITFKVSSASIFTTSLVLIYCAWLNLSSLMANPNNECFTFYAYSTNDGAGGTVMKVFSVLFTYIALCFSSFSYSGQMKGQDSPSVSSNETAEYKNETDEYKRPRSKEMAGNKDDIAGSISSYSSIRRSDQQIQSNPVANGESIIATSQPMPEYASSSTDVSDEDKTNVKPYVYPYWKMYLIYILASMHISVVIVGWSVTDREALSGLSAGASTAAMWSKTAAHWVCILLYIWLMIAPVVGPKLFPNRVWE